MGSSVFKMFTQLAIIFLYARNLSVVDYGLYQSVWLYINIASVISLFGLPALILSSPANAIAGWIKENKKYFLFFFGMLNFIPLAYILLAVTEYNFTTRVLLITLTVVQNIAVLIETAAIKKEKEKLVLITNLIFTAGYILCHLIILYANYSLQLLLAALIFIFIIKAALQYYFTRDVATDKSTILLKQLNRQWLYLGLNDVAGVIFKWLDKWVILYFISVAQFAVYFNGSYEIPVFGLMLSAAGSVMLVEMSRQNTAIAEKAKTLFKSSSVLLSSIVFPSFCFLFFYHIEFFTFIFSTKYAAAIPVFLISIFILPVRITNYTTVLQVYNRNDLILKGAVLDLIVAIVLMLILYPLLQLKGLAAAFVLSTYIQAGYYLWHTGKLIDKKISYFFPFRNLIFIMSVSILVTGIGYFISRNFSTVVNLSSGIILCILVIFVLLYNYHRTNKKDVSFKTAGQN
jgi:O-antigen/teichoic acid export membrane protein